MTKQQKQAVIQRDQKCRECGATENLTVDHVIPLSRGGTNIPENLRALCQDCNFRKGSHIQWGWFQRLLIALHVDEHITNLRDQIKGIIASDRGVTLARFEKIEAQHRNDLHQLRNELTNRHIVELSALKERLTAMEQYHNITYVVETKRGYEKVKTPRF